MESIRDPITLTMKCTKKNHNNSKIIAICYEKQCEYSRLLCTKCILKDHINHPDSIISIEDLDGEIKKLKEEKESIGDNGYRGKIDEIIELIQTKFLDELNKAKEKVFSQYEKNKAEICALSVKCDSLIENNLFTKLKLLLLSQNCEDAEETSNKIKRICREDTSMEVEKTIRNELNSLKFTIPNKEKVFDYLENSFERLKGINELFFNCFFIKYTDFIKNINSNDLIYDPNELLFSTSSSSIKNFVVISNTSLKSGYYYYEFIPGVDKNERYYSGFGILEESLMNFSSEWPQSSKSCYLNLTQMKVNNLTCNKNIAELKNLLVSKQTKIRCDLDFINDTFTVKILDFVFKNDKNFSFKNISVRPFFLLYRGAFNEIKFLP